MRLIDAVCGLASFHDDDVLFAREPWTAESETIVLRMPPDGKPEDDYDRRSADAEARGFSDFMWVCLIRESFADWLARSDVSREEKCARIIYYAINDA